MDDADAMDTDDLEEHYIPEGGIRIGMMSLIVAVVPYPVLWRKFLD